MIGLGMVGELAFAKSIAAKSEAIQSSGFNWNMVPSSNGDYCIDQAQEVLKQVYGDNIQINQVYVDSNGDATSYWMKTNLCAGHLVASFVKNAPCKSAHYGFTPSYIKRIWAHGASCQQVMPQEIVV